MILFWIQQIVPYETRLVSTRRLSVRTSGGDRGGDRGGSRGAGRETQIAIRHGPQDARFEPIEDIDDFDRINGKLTATQSGRSIGIQFVEIPLVGFVVTADGIAPGFGRIATMIQIVRNTRRSDYYAHHIIKQQQRRIRIRIRRSKMVGKHQRE